MEERLMDIEYKFILLLISLSMLNLALAYH